MSFLNSFALRFVALLTVILNFGKSIWRAMKSKVVAFGRFVKSGGVKIADFIHEHTAFPAAIVSRELSKKKLEEAKLLDGQITDEAAANDAMFNCPDLEENPPSDVDEFSDFSPAESEDNFRIVWKPVTFIDSRVEFHVSAEVIRTRIQTYDSPKSNISKQTPLVRSLFAIKGVSRISFERYQINIEKGELFKWDELRPQIEEVIRNYYSRKAAA